MRSPLPSRSARTVVAVTSASAALLAITGLAGAPAVAAEADVTRYVALGDSYASAAGVPDQVDAACTRSSRNYPSLVTAALDPAAARDVTCGGATTVHLTTSQNPTAPPQYDALSADTDLVTLTVGGNDVGFASIIVRCVGLGLLNPSGSPCRTSYTWTGTDTLARTIDDVAPRIAAAVDGIRARAPQARVLVTGYPAIVPDDGTNCPSVVSIAKRDAPWLRDIHKRLNSVIAKQAADRGATYVDTYSKSVGHDVCKPAATRWVEPLVTSAAAPFHPNAAGERAMADAVLASVG
ncbi:SGNH/GDSL hydrolase family protein [Streptomyces fulvorobeus]|uniref:Lipase n=1 Tax=Streptomyces fulvorobeus TaxID=284028 RepID=A0A7J0C340_9ACTN|nr:SGNH/GDSL hydrolase family protein [Streptomyces fulvorobeus]NYE40606.1 lysophospholipase L1-like esterase [Streptomyces fulvorobeus]GFM96900.1 lipase [Streptomyces fulvorobeus]